MQRSWLSIARHETLDVSHARSREAKTAAATRSHTVLVSSDALCIGM
jgi:hypothetical protein